MQAGSIGRPDLPVVTGGQLDTMSEAEVDDLVRSGQKLVFARTSPEANRRAR